MFFVKFSHWCRLKIYKVRSFNAKLVCRISLTHNTRLVAMTDSVFKENYNGKRAVSHQNLGTNQLTILYSTAFNRIKILWNSCVIFVSPVHLKAWRYKLSLSCKIEFTCIVNYKYLLSKMYWIKSLYYTHTAK